MNKLLISLVLILGFSFANAASHGVHGGSIKSDSAGHKAKIGLELPIAPVGAFRGGLF